MKCRRPVCTITAILLCLFLIMMPLSFAQWRTHEGWVTVGVSVYDGTQLPCQVSFYICMEALTPGAPQPQTSKQKLNYNPNSGIGFVASVDLSVFFNQSGEYVYRLYQKAEVDVYQPGVNVLNDIGFDAKERQIKFRITSDEFGNLSHEVSIIKGDSLTFYNQYKQPLRTITTNINWREVNSTEEPSNIPEVTFQLFGNGHLLYDMQKTISKGEVSWRVPIEDMNANNIQYTLKEVLPAETTVAKTTWTCMDRGKEIQGEGLQFNLPSATLRVNNTLNVLVTNYMEPVSDPTTEPTGEPTPEPTPDRTTEPTAEPTPDPTAEPTPDFTAEPTEDPTVEPTDEPTAEPTPKPTSKPTVEPTPDPTEKPTVEPTQKPTNKPAAEPTISPTAEQTATSTTKPTTTPTPVFTTTSIGTPTTEPISTPTNTTYPTVEVPISFRVIAEGKLLRAGTYAFGLFDSNRKWVATSSNDADGIVRFKNCKLSKEVENLIYTIRPLGQVDCSLQSDHKKLAIHVSTVAINGKLSARVDYLVEGIPVKEYIHTIQVEVPKTGDCWISVIHTLALVTAVLCFAAVMIKNLRQKTN